MFYLKIKGISKKNIQKIKLMYNVNKGGIEYDSYLYCSKLLYNYLQRSDCMIRIYTAPSCASCRKVKSWLNENKIPYVEKNIFSTLLKESELRELLERSENGTDDIISKRSKIIKENDIDIDSMKINDLIKFIQENPSVLKRPIMIDERRFQVGYNAEEIRVFIPKELRKLAECQDLDHCPQFSNKDCLNFKKEYEKDREKGSI